mgnify:CR=1 FL=1
MLLSYPDRTSLSIDQKERIVVIAKILGEVFPDTIQNWLVDFSRDSNLEEEIIIWENLAKAFSKINVDDLFSKQQKQEAFFLLLMRTMMPLNRILDEVNLKTFSKGDAKRILQGYEMKPKPVIGQRINKQFSLKELDRHPYSVILSRNYLK